MYLTSLTYRNVESDKVQYEVLVICVCHLTHGERD